MSQLLKIGEVMPNGQTVELPDLPRSLSLMGTGVEMPGVLPPRGVTILAVEDSRFASEALRLMCRRLGVRLRRAESIQAARSHLKLYRPTLVIVDLGLPDGRGEALIRDIVTQSAGLTHGAGVLQWAGATQSVGAPVVLGTSGDDTGRASALAAGAAGFLEKPMESFVAFQTELLRHLPDLISVNQITLNQIAHAPDADAPLTPDALALRDDFVRAAALIDSVAGTDAQTYLTGFVSGIARHANDQDLVRAAQGQDGTSPADRLNHLRQLLNHRLAATDQGFGTAANTST